jgi:hypothetical protein
MLDTLSQNGFLYYDLRNSTEESPVQRLNARLNALCSEKPVSKAISARSAGGYKLPTIAAATATVRTARRASADSGFRRGPGSYYPCLTFIWSLPCPMRSTLCAGTTHLHCMVPAGGLDRDGQWKHSKSKGKYLFNREVMGSVFRARYAKLLRKAINARQIPQTKVPTGLFRRLFAKPLLPKHFCSCCGTTTTHLLIAVLPPARAGPLAAVLGNFCEPIG